MDSKRLVIIGAGGFAREVRMLAGDITRSQDRAENYEFAGYLVSDPDKPGPHDSRDEILGNFTWLAAHRDAWDCLALGIGYAAPRLKVAGELEPTYGAEFWPSLVHPTAHFDAASCSLKHGVLICGGVQGTVNLAFGPFSAVNYGCTVGHETRLDRGAVLLPGSNIGGGVNIGEGAMVGSGAQVLQYLSVGDGAVVGAGSLVTKSVPAGKTAVGMPARWPRG